MKITLRQIDSGEWMTAFFAMYIIFTYVCVILCFIVERRLDTRQLNKLLNHYKQNEGRDSRER